MLQLNQIYNEDCLKGMKQIPDSSIDCIITDPPYLYLHNQKFDVPFDEEAFFDEVKRVLKDDGFIALFGRGASFYRWNTLLANRGIKFKEEIIWDKRNTTSPPLPLSRIHETISIHTKGKGKIYRSKIPYDEMRNNEDEIIVADAKRIVSYVRRNDMQELFDEVTNGVMKKAVKRKHNVTISSEIRGENRAVSTIKSIQNGFNEKDIISVPRENYTYVHPTQKPVRLLERIMALVSREGDVILDPFSGSGSTAIASINTHRNFIGFEIDKEYFVSSIERIRVAESK